MQISHPIKQKVAAYCRVSTDSEDQINSLDSQQTYFRNYILHNPLWELTQVYVDTGITGTSTKKRTAFNQMIMDAQSNQFDLILTKEISRFARNTLDSIFYTRKLKELGIGVIFMNDNINTLEPDAELRLTIMSSIAQEESRKTSERVKWGQKRQMEQGVVFGHSMLGYDVKDGKMNINEEGAEIVQLIFHKFVNEGKGTHVIARELQDSGIKTHHNMKAWSNTVILRILRNEKYAGDLVQKKTYTPSYLNHDKKYNNGEEEFIILKNHHTPIIDRELFNLASTELERRRPKEEQRTRHSNRYCFSGKLKCSYCGCTFISRTKKRKDNSIYKAWRCYEAANHGKPHFDNAGNYIGCDGRQVNNELLLQILSQIIKYLIPDKERVISEIISILKNVLQDNLPEKSKVNLFNKKNQLLSKKQSLIELYLDKEISKSDFQLINEKYEEEIRNLEKEYLQICEHANDIKNMDEVLNDMNHIIKDILDGKLQYETFYRNVLDKIVIQDCNHMEIYFKDLDVVIWKYG